MKSCVIRILAMLLAISSVLSLAGCGANTTPTTTGDAASSQQSTAASDSTTESSADETSEPSAAPEEPTAPTEKPDDEKNYYDLTEQQRNSFSMLYYLTITAEDIRISKNNRLMLDEIYTSLLNDINPGAIDETTQDHLKNLRDIIKSYIDISAKRDRLQYIYNQEKAETIRSAVPNPIAILSAANSLDWKRLAVSVVFTVVDSYNNYKSANTAVDQEFLMSGWELDDEETATIQKNRERAFDYMVDIVQEYGLDGKMTLNEESIKTFAEICAIESVQQKIRRLESEEETYKLLGNYWLELASCYFETSQYQKCLDCVSRYNDLATGIYRRDYNYVQVLPQAIVAAQKIYTGDEYVAVIDNFADSILENTTTEEWSLRYFAAQVYLELYARTDDQKYLQAAYDIAYDNVTILLDEQRALNRTYLEDVVELPSKEPDYRFMTEDEKKDAKREYKEEQKRLKEYNKGLKESRKTELPPLYEPLVLNCDLLFALAEKMNISSVEKREIEAILQTDTNGVFLSVPVNDRYSFSAMSNDTPPIEMYKDKVVVPASLLTANAQVVISVTDNGKTTTFDDCIVTKVERKGDTVDTFLATFSSKKLSDYTWTANAKVTVKISNGEDSVLTYRFKVTEYSANWILADKVVFEEE